VIVVGEALVDVEVRPHGATADGLAMIGRAGGSPANVAVGLARLGVRTRFAGRISDDGLGRFVRAHLAGSGVDTGLCVDAQQPSTLAMVGIGDDGAAGYSFYVEGTADWQWTADELPRPQAGTAVHTGSLAIGRPPGAQVIAEWVAQQRAHGGVFVSLDPNVRPALVLDAPGYRRRLAQLVAHAHLVKVSDEDLAALAPGVPPLQTASEWAHSGPQLVVVTHGAGGATALVAGAEALHCDAVEVDVVDTIGAGDAFTAGLLSFLGDHGALDVATGERLDRAAIAQALAFAGRVAAITCTRAGADPPSRAELDGAPLAGPA
jgi:fructokinase